MEVLVVFADLWICLDQLGDLTLSVQHRGVVSTPERITDFWQAHGGEFFC
jgi:hypothetical protein